MTKEKAFENKIKEFLKQNGCWYVKFFANSFTPSGIPDILACMPNDGKFLGIEVKAENGKPSQLQLHNLKKIDEVGGIAVLLYPEDFELFKEAFFMYQKSDPAFYVAYEQLKKRWMDAIQP